MHVQLVNIYLALWVRSKSFVWQCFFGWWQDKLISIKWGIVAPFQNHQELKIKFQRPTFNRKTFGEDFAKFSAFAAQRVGPDAAHATHKGKVAKTLNINDVDEETRKGMLEARQKVWDKYRSFNAAVAVSGAEKARLLSEGHQAIPSKWVDTIKNIHEMNSPDLKPVYKSRLVSCGNFESVNKKEIRCDSPTSEPESHLVLCSYAATLTLQLRTADITNAVYFQAAPMTRLFLMAPPRGGLTMFDAEVPEDAVLVCRVPVYGTKDAGRGFYLLRMNAEILARGFVASQVCPATYLFRQAQHLAAMMYTLVDNLLFAYTNEGKEAVYSTVFPLGRLRKVRFVTAIAVFLRMMITQFISTSETTLGT